MKEENKEILKVEESCIIGIGPYSDEVLPHLDYPPEYYKNCGPSIVVVVSFFYVSEHTEEVMLLCKCLGINDYSDLSLSQIMPDKVNEEELKAWSDKHVFDREEFDDFLFLLKQPEWHMYYHPTF